MDILRLIIGLFFKILEFTVLIECILSWIPGMFNSGLYYFISKVNKPFLSPVRKMLDRYSNSGLAIDISPYVLYLIITLLRRLLVI